jgi:hypothetical protein
MNGINIGQLKYCVVEPAISALGLNSAAALNLVTGTALAESGGVYLKQLGTGPALGLWQVEPATEQDIWTNFLKYRADLSSRVHGLLCGGPTTPQLVWNLAYCAAICRLKYYRAPDALPGARDAAAMADMHKRIYNSALGAADPAVNTPLFQAAIDA